MNTIKRCSTCSESKPLGEFYDHRTSADGKRGSCKNCVKRSHWKDGVKRGPTPRRPTSPSSRFWKYVVREGSCWTMMHKSRIRGYPVLFDHGNHAFASHISYEIHYSPVPAGLKILHHCDNRGCVNPEHLYVGTQKDNMRDCIERGRRRIGGWEIPEGKKWVFPLSLPPFLPRPLRA